MRSNYGSQDQASRTWDAANKTFVEREYKDADGEQELNQQAGLYDEVVKNRKVKNEVIDKESAPLNRRVVRNIDPFERKRRLAHGQSDFARSADEANREFSSRKIMSKKEARAENDAKPQMNTSQYLDATRHFENKDRSSGLKLFG